jgi:integrase/recombinase XerD
VNLDISNIDTDARLLTVRRKGGQEQSVPINSDITRLIRLFTKGKDKSEPLIISSFGKRITQRRVGLLIQEYFKKAGIQKQNISCHSLRHAFCSRLLEKGVDLKTIQLLAGHKNISTTERYLHIANTKLRKEAMLAEIH